jgi:deoxyribose-phosphate aldolase
MKILKEILDQAIVDDISNVSREVQSKGKIVKVILEISLLTGQDKIMGWLGTSRAVHISAVAQKKMEASHG